MPLYELSPCDVTNPDTLRETLLEHEVVISRGYEDHNRCFVSAIDLPDGRLMPLPTDGGGVYDIYPDEFIPPRLREIADRLGKTISLASGLAVVEGKPSLHEALRYREGASLTGHRDLEGRASTKTILTLSGIGVFEIEDAEFSVVTGDLVIMRGREFSGEAPTPWHATKHNFNRRMLLAEPNYVKHPSLTLATSASE